MFESQQVVIIKKKNIYIYIDLNFMYIYESIISNKKLGTKLFL